jgi:hypothetical protein
VKCDEGYCDYIFSVDRLLVRLDLLQTPDHNSRWLWFGCIHPIQGTKDLCKMLREAVDEGEG